MASSPPAILVEHQPEWEFRGGFFFVTWEGQSWAYPPVQFFQMLTRMAKVAREYRVVGGEVLPFKQPKRIA
jgi:hypothetical protein